MQLPPTLTRLEHYAQLPLVTPMCASRIWTPASALTSLALYVREEGQWPLREHLCVEEGMPSYETVLRLFGSLKAWRMAYLDAYALGPPILLPSPYARRIACNRCERMWKSPDVRQFRTCKRCRRLETHDDLCTGDWMNGTSVVYAGLSDTDLWEEEM